MTHALVTIAAPLAADNIATAFNLIAGMGNPATPAIAAALARLDGDDGVHFTSLHAIPPDDPQGGRGNVLLEFSADGSEDAALARLVERIGAQLAPIFALCADWRPPAGEASNAYLTFYLTAHKVRLGQGWFGEAGLAFAGTPGMSVGRIHREDALAQFLTDVVGGQDAGLPALARLDAARTAVRKNGAFAWALDAAAALPVQPKPSTAGLVASLAVAFAQTYLWPLLIPLALGFVVGAAVSGVPGFGPRLMSGLMAALATAGMLLVLTLAAAAYLYLSLRAKEASDWTSERAPERGVLREITARENRGAQNHMISVTQQKPGLTRWLTIRLAFWLVLGLASRSFRPGFLGDIGTIHFARWVTLPGTRQVVFLSNYGGSWESYLEDFITKAHNGLTAVWSNTVGFPRAENLFQKGATDGERFKRYARQSMAPTPFWYSAYTTLSTANIRTNAAIRVGLAGAMTDEEAKTWLALFGSAARPASKLESDQIQSLVFGGLGFMPAGELLLADFAKPGAATRKWLHDILPEVAFNDGRRFVRTGDEAARDAVVTLALGPGALGKAGLSGEALETFPPAYLDGMSEPGRARILGDVPGEPWWWKTDGTYDAAILVYGRDDAAVARLSAKVSRLLTLHGHGKPVSRKLAPVADKASERLEAFSFVDGTSQPVIKGTYRGLRDPDPIHLVEPGEFILGYPDNRNNLPPGPHAPATEDPQNLLPIRCSGDAGFGSNVVDAPRDIGRNGSFLVIRQLEQDVDGFWKYCEDEAKRLKPRFGVPYDVTRDFIAAKLIGRWRDGSSLVRNPYLPFTHPKNQRPAGKAGAKRTRTAGAIAAAQAGDRLQKPTQRLPTSAASPIPPPAYASPMAADNDFLFGVEDAEGLRCPYGAHIRRANPRDSLEPGSQDQIDISNRHRILRVGRGYRPARGQKPGLMFMCLNGDLERQFEFVQQTWLGSTTFHGLAGERDPIATHKDACPIGYTIPTRDGPVRLKEMRRFVTPRGGGYFFLPGKRFLEFLAS